MSELTIVHVVDWFLITTLSLVVVDSSRSLWTEGIPSPSDMPILDIPDAALLRSYLKRHDESGRTHGFYSYAIFSTFRPSRNGPLPRACDGFINVIFYKEMASRSRSSFSRWANNVATQGAVRANVQKMCLASMRVQGLRPGCHSGAESLAKTHFQHSQLTHENRYRLYGIFRVLLMFCCRFSGEYTMLILRTK